MTNAEILKAEFKAAVKSRFGTATPENPAARALHTLRDVA
jgi:hypothetical protein